MKTKFQDLTIHEEIICKWQHRMMGDFRTALMKTIALADESNLQRLSLSFPDEVEAFRLYSHQNGWWQSVQKKLGPSYG